MTKAKGNMYQFITHTHNPIKGICPHACTYCYMNSINKRFNKTPKPIYLDLKELKKNLGSGNFIFVGSSCDIWAESISDKWIIAVLKQLENYPNNKYLFQSKNPMRFIEFDDYLPDNCHVGTTIETNRKYPCMGETPSTDDRSIAIDRYVNNFITIEPILDFDIDPYLGDAKKRQP
jgi:DNA repair photolyase